MIAALKPLVGAIPVELMREANLRAAEKRIGRRQVARWLGEQIAQARASCGLGFLELERARFGHLQHATAGLDARDGALAQRVIQAIGVAVLDPQPLRDAQLLALLCLAGLSARSR